MYRGINFQCNESAIDLLGKRSLYRLKLKEICIYELNRRGKEFWTGSLPPKLKTVNAWKPEWDQ